MATSPASGSADHVLLVGMMGAGKSSVGKLLSDRLSRPFVDVDAAIEDEEGMAIATIFETRGEAAFRDLEANMLVALLANPVAAVLSVGGGAVTESRNRAVLHRQPQVVWLRASGATLAAHVGDGPERPLLAGKHVGREVTRLSEQREPMYAEVAKVVVDVDGLSVEDVVERVAAAVA